MDAISYTRSTTIETWLINLKLDDYISYFRETLGVRTLKDLLPFIQENLTKDDLLREWEDFEFKTQVSPIHQSKIAREMSKLTFL